MANFIINSMGTQAIRKSDISSLKIEQSTATSTGGAITAGDFVLYVKTKEEPRFGIPFEHATTLEAVQALAGPIITALEE